MHYTPTEACLPPNRVRTAAACGMTPAMAPRTLERPLRGQGRVVAGVCAALADRFGMSRTLVRVIFLVFALVGAGEIAYVIGWIVIPRADR